MSEAEPAIARYVIEAGRSRFTTQAFAGGLLSAFGHNPVIAIRDFTGVAQFQPGALAGASLRITVRADSLTVVSEVSEKDRRDIERAMFNDALETARYPEIVFVSKSVEARHVAEGQHRVRIIGELALRGVRRDVEIEPLVTINDEGLRAQGDFALKQSDFGIKPVSVAAGALKLKDELKFSFDIVGRRAF